jgi:ketosteroid isomerase-like protein
MARPMCRSTVATLLLLGCACRGPNDDLKAERIAAAERYFRGVYGSDTSVVDDLAGDDIVVSYPIFQRLYGTTAIRGRDAVKAFVTRFSQKWVDPQFEFHDAVSDGDSVVLVWSFRARDVAPPEPGQPASDQEHGWGGITVLRFDGAGKIVVEVGEESDPGPTERLSRSQPK